MRTLMAVVAEPRRQAILRLVWNEERKAADIAASFDITFGAVSQHLRALLDAGAVRVRKEGRLRWYRAQKEALGPLAVALEAMWCEHLQRLKVLAEGQPGSGGQETPASSTDASEEQRD